MSCFLLFYFYSPPTYCSWIKQPDPQLPGACQKAYREMQEITSWCQSRCGNLREVQYPKDNLHQICASGIHKTLQIDDTYQCKSIQGWIFPSSLQSESELRNKRTTWIPKESRSMSLFKEKKKVFAHISKLLITSQKIWIPYRVSYYHGVSINQQSHALDSLSLSFSSLSQRHFCFNRIWQLI